MRELQFTPREVAELSGAPKSAVEKAIEERVVPARKVRIGRRERRVLPIHAIAYAKFMRAMPVRMDLRSKRAFARAMARAPQFGSWRYELSPAVELNVGRVVGEAVEHARAYAAARDRLIVEDPDILGGTPVIRGTRLSVHSILGRLNGGERIEDLIEDYPDLTREAVETATIYARSHPLVGRPGGRPWSTAA
jgi:uncharacterized protein (DUF433 family)